MAQIAFILLCHKDPEAIVRQAEQLTAVGDYVAIHFDARASAADYKKITDGLAGNSNVTFAAKRIRCGWGEWSLVEATLNALHSALRAFPRASHFYMVSGDCMAIKSGRYAHAFLDRADCDYVESFDYFESGWIKTGLKEERLIYRHWFNERTQSWRFYTSLKIQQRLGLTREVPDGIKMMIGSQWWCLRRLTVEAIVEFCKARPEVMRFFKTTWIPDETFFQTLVRHLVPRDEIRSRPLTFLMFTDYGLPVTFYNDHYDMLLGQDYLFARKISPEAARLKERLGQLYASEREDFAISGEGRKLYQFLTGRGREGRRFAPRFWEAEATMGRGRELLILTCKKWHVAKRLTAAIREHTGLPALQYLFDENEAGLPPLGGIEVAVAKRARHRRTLIKMLFDYYESDKLVICVDPSQTHLFEDFYADSSATRLLEIETELSDAYLMGHARRVGLAGEHTPEAALERLLPTIRGDISHEAERLRDRGFPNSFRIQEQNTVAANGEVLAEFLGVDPGTAEAVAGWAHLFAD